MLSRQCAVPYRQEFSRSLALVSSMEAVRSTNELVVRQLTITKNLKRFHYDISMKSAGPRSEWAAGVTLLRKSCSSARGNL